ncbi:MAG: TIGR03435 family protein [Candidatus Acidiferrales bacterium]
MSAGVLAAAAPIVFGLANATPGRAQAQAQTQTQTQTQVQTQSPAQAPGQTTPLDLSKFEYEVASFKPDKSDTGMTRMQSAPDGFSATNMMLQNLVTSAFGIQNYQLEGAPSWLTSERFDIDAKMDPAVSEAFQKLSPEDRNLARQHMFQVLLADRCNLKFHRESKELPVYALVIGKNGSKLKEAKPDDTYPNGIQGAGGRGGRGVMSMNGRGGAQTMTGQAVPIGNLARTLASFLGRPVLDKTGLTGMYDYTLQWSPEDTRAQAPSGGGDGQPPAAPSEPAGPTLLMAVQDQLGLKLESGKGPVEIIVIEHIERPSEN